MTCSSSTPAARPTTTATIACSLLMLAFGGLLHAPDADAKAARSKPAPVRALVATNLAEAGGSRVAIRLAKPAPRTVKVLVQTHAIGGAHAASSPADFTARSQWVTIKRGAKVGYFTPKITNDTIDEKNERLQVRLLKSTAWAKLPAIKHRSAIMTILDDDAAPSNTAPNAPAPSNPAPKVDPPTKVVVPSITVSDAQAQVVEGDAANATARFTVTLDAPTTVPVDAPFSIVDGSAAAGADFAAVAAGTLTFAPGVTERTIDVLVLDDDIDEDVEHAQLVLGSPTGATLSTGTGELTILDDEVAPNLAIMDVEANEGTGAATIFSFQAKLSHPSSKVITMSTHTFELSANGGPNCAVLGVDYVAFGPKVITFQPGETVKDIPVKVCGDNGIEADEYFALPLADVVNATVTNPQGIGRIENDD